MDNKSKRTVAKLNADCCDTYCKTVGKFNVVYCYDNSYSDYRILGDEYRWGIDSAFGVIYCQVYFHNVYIDDFYIHKADMEQYIGNEDDKDIDFQSPDFDGFKIVDNMIKSGWFEGFFLSQFERDYKEKISIIDIVRPSLEILFNINHTINLLESIGINIDGSISDSSIGSDLYESSTAAYQVIESAFNIGPEQVTKIAEIVEGMYKECKLSDDYNINKDQIIDNCLANLMEFYNLYGEE